MAPPAGRQPVRCSFCGKRQDEVRKVVAGPGVYICDQCIALCSEIMQEDRGRQGGPRAHLTSRAGGGRRGPRGWLDRWLRAQPIG